MKKYSFLKSLLCLVGLSAVVAAQAASMTQTEYDQFIAEQTKVVNETKVILDESNSAQQKTNAKVEREAFCQRVKAYQNILKTSEENIRLNMAPIMVTVAQSFLDRQAKSFANGGMTDTVFCKSTTAD